MDTWKENTVTVITASASMDTENMVNMDHVAVDQFTRSEAEETEDNLISMQCNDLHNLKF